MLRFGVFFMLAFSVAACGNGGQHNALAVGEVNESRAQAPARIKIAANQVYRRETLINDRRRERVWLEKELADSEDAVCEPQIARDLETIRQVALELGLAFDPAKGLDFRRANERAAIEHSIELERLRGELDRMEELRRQLQATIELAQQAKPQGLEAAGGFPTLPNLGTPTTPGTLSNSAPTAPSLTELTKIMTDLKNAIQAIATSDIKRSKSGLSPIELLECRETIRARIRSRHNSAGLDDLHDEFGNKLVRIDFAATVFPGKHKD